MAVTLASIGDAVIVTDRAGRITFMNTAAERLTGWTADEARGSALPTVFVIVNEETRGLVEIPAARVLLENQVVAVPAGTMLARRGGDERAIDGSVAPIHDRAGGSVGVVLVFRDLTERRARERDQVEGLAREQVARRDAAALSAVGQALVQSLDTESVGRHIAEGIRVLLGGTVSVLWELEHASNRLVAVATSGSGSPFPPGTRIPQDEALAGFAERAGRLFDGAGFAYLFDEESQSLGARVWGRAEPESEAPFPAEGGMVASCAGARRGLLVNDYPDSPFALPAVVHLGVRHAMAQPLVSRDRL